VSDLDHFLKHSVEGYLFEDIETLKRAERLPEKTKGGVGYPLLLTAFAGIELLGALVSKETFHKRGGETYFTSFWREYLYPDEPRASVGTAIYKLARHGLAHVFVVKGDLVVVKNEPKEHLVRVVETGGLVINAVQLADDLIDAYQSKVKPLLDVDQGEINRETMSKRLDDMEKAYRSDAEFFSSHLENLPPAESPHPIPGASGPLSSYVTTNEAHAVSGTEWSPPGKGTEKGTVSPFYERKPEDRL
jgi:hypothetical protein